jgi:hypothetical protein
MSRWRKFCLSAPMVLSMLPSKIKIDKDKSKQDFESPMNMWKVAWQHAKALVQGYWKLNHNSHYYSDVQSHGHRAIHQVANNIPIWNFGHIEFLLFWTSTLFLGEFNSYFKKGGNRIASVHLKFLQNACNVVGLV